jgi:hypothetical protein
VKVSFCDVPIEQLSSRLPVAVPAPHPPVQPDPEAHSFNLAAQTLGSPAQTLGSPAQTLGSSAQTLGYPAQTLA